MLTFSIELQLLLALIAFLAGIGTAAIGPGGIFLTISLFALTALSPSQVAGTASATFIATGFFGTAVYLRSGELGRRESRHLALMLGATSVVGALLGAQVNTRISPAIFGALLGLATGGTGILIIYREWRGLSPRLRLDFGSSSGRPVLLALGFGIGILGGLLGVGGPVLAVPALVVLGVPLLTAVAVAQVQSVFVAVFATAGYVLHGAVVWPLALWVGVPELAGVLVGWKIARRVEPAKLKLVLGAVLILLAPYLALGT